MVCLLFYSAACFLTAELWELLVYSGYWSLFSYVSCKYLLPVCGLLFHFLNSGFQRIDALNFAEVQIIIFFRFHILCPKKSLPNARSQRFFSRIFIILAFTHSLWSTLYYFLYVVWGTGYGSFSFLFFLPSFVVQLQLSQSTSRPPQPPCSPLGPPPVNPHPEPLCMWFIFLGVIV